MSPAAFRAAAHAVVDVMADYLETIESRAVFPSIEPGSLRPLFPAAAPERPEPLDAILADYRRLVEPNATHWQHPGFLAYFATTASGPGILGEMLTAALGQNPMLWRTSPIGTELEGVVVDWLRQAFGLPETFDGLLTDTASTSSLIALAAARQAAGVDAAQQGLTGRAELPALRVYASAEAHSSIEKACMTLGLGRDALVRIPTNERFEMRTRRAARRHRRRSRRRPPTDRDRRDARHHVVDVGRPGRRDRRHRRARGAVAARRLGLRRRGRAAPGPPGAVRRLGARRLDRREPAQVAVHAARRVAAADPPDGRARARRSASSRSTCGRSTARRRSATTTSTRPSSGGASARSSCGSSCAGSASTGCARRIARAPRAGRSGSRRRSTPTRTGSGWRRSRSRRSASAGDRRAGPGRTRRSTTPTPRSWTRSIGRARCSCRTPGSMAGSRSASRSGTCGPSGVTSSAPGRCSARRQPSRPGHEARAA